MDNKKVGVIVTEHQGVIDEVEVYNDLVEGEKEYVRLSRICLHDYYDDPDYSNPDEYDDIEIEDEMDYIACQMIDDFIYYYEVEVI